MSGRKAARYSLQRRKHFYGGSYYNLIALPGDAFTSPQLLIAETSVQRGSDIPAMMPMVETVAVAACVKTVETEVPVAVVGTPSDFDGPTASCYSQHWRKSAIARIPDQYYPVLSVSRPLARLLNVLGRRGLTEYYGGEPADEPVDLSDFDTPIPLPGWNVGRTWILPIPGSM